MGKKKTRGKQREVALDPETIPDEEAVSRRKSKKDRMSDSFFDETETREEEEEEKEIVEDNEDLTLQAHNKTSKSKKKKNTFAALDIENSDNEPKAEAEAEEEEEEEEFIPKGKQKQSSNAFASFAQDEEASDGQEEEDEEPEVTKQKAKNAFAILEEEENGEHDEVEIETTTVNRKKSKKKKKKSGIKMDNLFDEVMGEDNADIELQQQEETTLNESTEVVEVANVPNTKGKSKSKERQDSFDATFAELEEEVKEAVQESVPETKPKKGKKKKGKSSNFDALFQEIDQEEEGEMQEHAVQNEEAEPTIEEAVETILPDTENPPPVSISEETQQPKSKEKKKKKKGGKAKSEDEDLDALLAEIEGDKQPTASTTQEQKAEETKTTSSHEITEPVVVDEESSLKNTVPAVAVESGLASTVDVLGSSEVAPESAMNAELSEMAAEEKTEEGEVKLTAAQKKKQKKKDKKAREKEQQKTAAEGESKGKKVSAGVRKIQEQLEKKRLEEEKRRQEEEAERLRLAEEEQLRQEEELRKQHEAEQKEKEKADRERLKKEGKLLTKKQKAEQARLAAVRDQLLKSSGRDVSSTIGQDKPVANAQEQRRIQREREEAKRRAEEERLKAEEEERLEKEREEKRRQVELEARQKEEEELRRKQAEEDKIADNWEDISEDENAEAEAKDLEIKNDDDDDEEEEEEEEESSEFESEEETESDESEISSSEYSTDSEEARDRQIQAAKQKAEARIEEARAAASSENLRSPICCILGHVDTGKTKILDNIRRTNVQDNEAGGITQQIGATYIPSDALLTRTAELRKGRDYEIKVPGLLVIDTPGHESFTNLRTRGSSLCDIAILVVDLMHGLEAQTLESIELLRQKKTPFIIALNKVDRLNEWKVVSNAPIRESLNRQKKHTLLHYEDRLQACTTMLMERGLNVALYWKNKEPRKIVNMVPTSAITGEGIADMLQLLIKLTTSLMAEKLMFLSEVQCSVLEVKAIEGLGTTVDVVLVNGQLNEGDKIVVCGMTGPIVTTIRSLLTPHPLKELRVKGSYVHHKSIQAAQGIKICAQNLEQAVAGTALRVVREDEEKECKLLAVEEMEDVLSRIDKTGEGVSVQASTLGSLEALLEFLKSPDVQIPVSAIGIGPVHKKDVMRANVMNEKKIKKFAVILAFDVPVTKEARDMAEELNVKIFTADIIYHLFDQFKAYVDEVRQSEKRAASADAVFPCILEILPNCIFNKKDPIVLGCEVLDGQARIGTPLVVPAKGDQGEVSLGKIESMELNHKAVEKAERGENVALKIQSTNPEEAARLYGRHFDHTDHLYSKISRESINALKTFFRDEMTTPDWNLVIKLKKIYQIE